MKEQLGLQQRLSVNVAPDQMTALLQFIRCDDDFACTAAELEQFLRASGITYGIQYDLLHAISNDPASYSLQQTPIAHGLPPKTGKDGRIAYVVEMNADQRPEESEDGKVDFKETSKILNVQKGQLIARKLPATEGEPGKTVTGIAVPGRKGKEARLKAGKNVVCNADRTLVYAAIDGLFTITGGDSINVFPVYEVNGDVDYHTGHIDFVGTVVVRGNVLTGFRVRAAGDIRVVGGVEGAELETDGSIEITGGIMGGGKGSVKAGHSVRCSFIQDGTVFAGEDVLVSQSIMHSQVRAGRNVVCGGAKGLLVGGVVQAGETVQVRTAGNTMSTATSIEVGVKPELREELKELRIAVRSKSEALDKTEKALAILDQMAAAGTIASDKLALRIKLSATKKQAVQEIEEARDRILDIERSLEDSSTAKVEVRGTVFGGTKIVIGRYTRFIKEPTSRVQFRFIEGEINMGQIV
ncbi:FapA family protein [Paenibacillus sp. FSL W8-1187]|uniref:Flagellar Assembly Protein A N-terminal region domain-containing protein n=1 Tax=Paenibacillus pasadenensis TaxID=217090 RepID=A0A2N5N778_9BACL|nr:FapA family protein [Paenibacillus pasadenensis]PLT46173.1 protein of unknown function DUF342 [Paenibacillus pasadenensis]